MHLIRLLSTPYPHPLSNYLKFGPTPLGKFLDESVSNLLNMHFQFQSQTVCTVSEECAPNTEGRREQV